jgi:hypothetical protein
MVNDKPIIKTFLHWFRKNGDVLPRHLTRQLLQLESMKQFCLEFPTCEGCPFREEYKGCMFRGKIPREW